MESTTIIIPAWNESRRIVTTLQSIQEFTNAHRGTVFPVLVVDDGSTDGTADVVQQLAYPNVHVLQLSENRGKFAAFVEGVRHATTPWVLLYDADGATPIDTLATAWEEKGDVDCVIGSRAVDGAVITERQHPLREIFGRGANGLIRLATGLPYADTQCGFKLIRTPLAKQVVEHMHIQRFAGDIELLLLIHTFGGTVAELPIEWHDVPISTVRWGDYLRTARDLLQIRRNIKTQEYGKTGNF